MSPFVTRHARAIAWGITALAVAGFAFATLALGYDVIDALLGVELVLLLLVGMPLSIRGTALLVDAVMTSTVNDRLARAITAYLTLVTVTGLYLVGLQLWRFVSGDVVPDWVRPITGLLSLLVLCGPAYVVNVAVSRRRD